LICQGEGEVAEWDEKLNKHLLVHHQGEEEIALPLLVQNFEELKNWSGRKLKFERIIRVFVPITLKLIEVKNESKQVGVVDNNLPKIVMKSISI